MGCAQAPAVIGTGPGLSSITAAVHAEAVASGNDDRRGESQEERALSALGAIFSGGDMTEETTRLANEFTDRQSSRFSGWFARRRSPRHRSRDEPATEARDETPSVNQEPLG
jgi:hypothetical protein